MNYRLQSDTFFYNIDLSGRYYVGQYFDCNVDGTIHYEIIISMQIHSGNLKKRS